MNNLWTLFSFDSIIYGCSSVHMNFDGLLGFSGFRKIIPSFLSLVSFTFFFGIHSSCLTELVCSRYNDFNVSQSNCE